MSCAWVMLWAGVVCADVVDDVVVVVIVVVEEDVGGGADASCSTGGTKEGRCGGVDGSSAHGSLLSNGPDESMCVFGGGVLMKGERMRIGEIGRRGQALCNAQTKTIEK